jgi:hypothetical protein
VRESTHLVMRAWVEYKQAWGKCESQAILLGKSESQASMGEEGNLSRKRGDKFLHVDFWAARGELGAGKEHQPCCA